MTGTGRAAGADSANTATVADPTAVTPTGRGGTLTGTITLIRFALRRDRVRLPVWVAALSLSTGATAAGLPATAPEAADRAALAEAVSSPAGLAMNGPAHYLSDFTYGAMLSHQMLASVTLLVALMAVLTVTRHTRTEEETGRSELLRAGVLGRHAQLTAALTVAALACLAVGLLTAASLSGLDSLGFTVGGAVLFGACYTAIGLVFAGAAAVTAQLSAYGRAASGMALAALGLAYALRAAGDSAGADGSSAWLSWLSPVGWVQRTYVYVDDRWWPLLLCTALTAALVTAAFRLSDRRDVGAGILAARLGPPHGAPSLARPLGLTVRLQRPLFIGFATALVLFGAMYGAVLGDAENMLSSIDALQDAVAQMATDSLTEGFAAMVMLPLVLVAAVHTVMAALRPRAEETAGRAETLLATGLSRSDWLGSHLAVALGGSTVALALGGLAFGAAGALTTGDAGLLLSLTGSALAYAPVLWFTGAVTAALVGWWPQGAQAAWALPVAGFFVGYLGALLDFPQWLLNIDPFGHIPQVPAEPMNWTPLVVLTVLAAVASGLGLTGFRRRDLDLK